MKIWIKLTKKWGEFAVGDVAEFDERKGGDLIAKGMAEKAAAPKQKEVQPLIDETAAETMEPETTDARPHFRTKKDVYQKRKVKNGD